jgi:DnaJ-class molecular chaperone
MAAATTSCPVCAAEVVECTVCFGSGTAPDPAGAAQTCGNCSGKGFVHASTGRPDGCHE